MRDYSVLDDLEEGVQIISPDLRYIYLNKKLLSEIQMTSAETVGHLMKEKFPGIDKTQIYSEIISCIRHKKTKKFVNEFKFADGRQSFYEIVVQAIQEGVILFSRDITKLKRGELLLKETNKDLEQFTFMAAHTLREPLKLIESLSELLIIDYEDTVPYEAKELCRKILTQATQGLHMINSLREISGLKNKDMNKEIFSLSEMFKENINIFLLLNKKIYFLEHQKNIEIYSYSSLVDFFIKKVLQNILRDGKNNLCIKRVDEEKQIFCIENDTDSKWDNMDIIDRESMKIIERHLGKVWTELSEGRMQVYFSLEKQ